MIETIPFLESGKEKPVNVYLGKSYEFQGLEFKMTFRDSLYNWYSQEVRIEKKFVNVENFEPMPIDPDESLYKKMYSDRRS